MGADAGDGAGADAQAAQLPGQAVGAAIELTEGEVLAAVDHRHRLRRAARLVGEPAVRLAAAGGGVTAPAPHSATSWWRCASASSGSSAPRLADAQDFAPDGTNEANTGMSTIIAPTEVELS